MVVCPACNKIQDWLLYEHRELVCTGCRKPFKASIAERSPVFPFTTTHISGDGSPMVIENLAHLRRVERDFGVVLPAFSKSNVNDLDPIKDPPTYRGWDDDQYLSPDPDRREWAARRGR
jgi:hypothetical protein